MMIVMNVMVDQKILIVPGEEVEPVDIYLATAALETDGELSFV